ncbi:hypothetical protein [Cellulomonas soli]
MQDEADNRPTLAIALGAAVAIVAAGLMVLLLRRRVTQRDELVPERAWRHLRHQLAGQGLDWTDATTPRVAVEALQRMLAERTGHVLDGPALEALTALARAVETERYAPSWNRVPSGELERWVDQVVDAVRRGLNDRSRRAGAPNAPRTGP